MTWISQQLVLQHIPKFTGDLWYVSKSGSDANGGQEPDDAFLTIGAAYADAAAGDAITIKAGDYTENITINKDALEIWGEIGAVLIGTLTLTSDKHRIKGIVIQPAAAVGLVINGNFSVIEDVLINGTPTTAFDINGSTNTIKDCTAFGYTVTGYDIAESENHFYECIAHGDGGARRGFYLTHANADDCFLKGCTSLGNATASFHLITGISNVMLINCASGGGDGRWIDVDEASIWTNFHFADFLEKRIDLTTAQTQNLFQVTGTVKVIVIHGVVEEIVTTAGVPTIHLSVFSANGEVDITADPGPNIANDVIGTVYIRNADSGNALVKGENDNTPFIIENGSFQNPEVSVIVGADDAATTYIRFNSNATLTDGEIDWYVEWEPVSDDGWLAAV